MNTTSSRRSHHDEHADWVLAPANPETRITQTGRIRSRARAGVNYTAHVHWLSEYIAPGRNSEMTRRRMDLVLGLDNDLANFARMHYLEGLSVPAIARRRQSDRGLHGFNIGPESRLLRVAETVLYCKTPFTPRVAMSSAAALRRGQAAFAKDPTTRTDLTEQLAAINLLWAESGVLSDAEKLCLGELGEMRTRAYFESHGWAVADTRRRTDSACDFVVTSPQGTEYFVDSKASIKATRFNATGHQRRKAEAWPGRYLIARWLGAEKLLTGGIDRESGTFSVNLWTPADADRATTFSCHPSGLTPFDISETR